MGERYHEGKLIGRFGDTPAGTELGKFLAPHGLAVDSRGDICVGRFPGPPGHRFTQGNHTPPTSDPYRNSKGSNKNPGASLPPTSIVARPELKHHKQERHLEKPTANSG
jgi:hypothetical protein